MRTAIYLFYGLEVEIRPKMDPPELFIHLGGAIGPLNACIFGLHADGFVFGMTKSLSEVSNDQYITLRKIAAIGPPRKISYIPNHGDFFCHKHPK